MRALVHDPDAPRGLRLGEAPDPTPAPGQALVEVAAMDRRRVAEVRLRPPVEGEARTATEPVEGDSRRRDR